MQPKTEKQSVSCCCCPKLRRIKNPNIIFIKFVRLRIHYIKLIETAFLFGWEKAKCNVDGYIQITGVYYIFYKENIYFISSLKWE